MGKSGGLALRGLQFFTRSVQFCSGALVFTVFCYFLATLMQNKLEIPLFVRVVTGVSGVSVLYTGVALLVLCCAGGHPFAAFITISMDILFMAGFIYIAVINRAGTGKCTGIVNTPFGVGNSETNVAGEDEASTSAAGAATDAADDGTVAAAPPKPKLELPNLKMACNMQKACLASSIITVLFLLLSIIIAINLVKNRKANQQAALDEEFRKGEEAAAKKNASQESFERVPTAGGVNLFLGRNGEPSNNVGSTYGNFGESSHGHQSSDSPYGGNGNSYEASKTGSGRKLSRN
ncbi:hypothetical protein B0H63DRAFT_247327 [Podospora didyma]|uniref:MARVEL domain-containing protein n=1 Tax=Podospora didyma TaxID=330526 RepID=A0AAE0KLR1_9PEZI|nr:hypothetical protein B0H63DRAFT_247327 [Podospora didyma]